MTSIVNKAPPIRFDIKNSIFNQKKAEGHRQIQHLAMSLTFALKMMQYNYNFNRNNSDKVQ